MRGEGEAHEKLFSTMIILALVLCLMVQRIFILGKHLNAHFFVACRELLIFKII